MWLVGLLVGVMALPAAAQFGAASKMRPTIIKGVRILQPDGTLSEPLCVKIQGKQIVEVAPEIKTNFLLDHVVAGSGRVLAPGFIDCWSRLGLDASGGAAADPTARVLDEFDPYATGALMDALSQGVTAALMQPPASSGVTGMTSVVRLAPTGSVGDRTLLEEGGLHAAVGGGGPLSRVSSVQSLQKILRDAVEYREAQETYEEDLEDYETKIKERAEKEAKEEQEAKGDDSQDGEKKGKKGNSMAAGRRGKGKPGKGEPGKGEPAKNVDQKGKEEEIKKPEPPNRSPANEVYLRLLDGELRLWMEAYRPEDILNVLALADEFSLKVVLVGASGAHLVADEIAKADVPVVLGQTVRTDRFEYNTYRFHTPEAAALLAAAGVDVYVGGGYSETGTRFLGLNTALAVGHGWDKAAALRALTSGAAELLGIDDELGRVARGYQADLVLWSGDPLASNATVEKVFLEGKVVYDAEQNWRLGVEE